MNEQLRDTHEKLCKVEVSIESLATSLSSKQDELAKSLKDIGVAYKKNILQLGKDLNKMEFRVTQIRDTRERISLKHIKSLDIVEKEIHRIMPNSLTKS